MEAALLSMASAAGHAVVLCQAVSHEVAADQRAPSPGCTTLLARLLHVDSRMRKLLQDRHAGLWSLLPAVQAQPAVHDVVPAAEACRPPAPAGSTACVSDVIALFKVAMLTVVDTVQQLRRSYVAALLAAAAGSKGEWASGLRLWLRPLLAVLQWEHGRTAVAPAATLSRIVACRVATAVSRAGTAVMAAAAQCVRIPSDDAVAWAGGCSTWAPGLLPAGALAVTTWPARRPLWCTCGADVASCCLAAAPHSLPPHRARYAAAVLAAVVRAVAPSSLAQHTDRFEVPAASGAPPGSLPHVSATLASIPAALRELASGRAGGCSRWLAACSALVPLSVATRWAQRGSDTSSWAGPSSPDWHRQVVKLCVLQSDLGRVVHHAPLLPDAVARHIHAACRQLEVVLDQWAAEVATYAVQCLFARPKRGKWVYAVVRAPPQLPAHAAGGGHGAVHGFAAAYVRTAALNVSAVHVPPSPQMLALLRTAVAAVTQPLAVLRTAVQAQVAARFTHAALRAVASAVLASSHSRVTPFGALQLLADTAFCRAWMLQACPHLPPGAAGAAPAFAPADLLRPSERFAPSQHALQPAWREALEACNPAFARLQAGAVALLPHAALVASSTRAAVGGRGLRSCLCGGSSPSVVPAPDAAGGALYRALGVLGAEQAEWVQLGSRKGFSQFKAWADAEAAVGRRPVDDVF